MNPGDVLAVSLIPAIAGGGEFPFKAELAGGTLQGYPVIQSSNVAADTMLLVDAADFVSVTGDSPRFDVSDQATLHMEDTTPLQIGTTGSPKLPVAAPVRSVCGRPTRSAFGCCSTSTGACGEPASSPGPKR